MTEPQLREQLRKISALHEGATTPGERSAAAAAIERVKKAIAALSRTEPVLEFQLKMPDLWHRRLFCAVCRRHGVETFRYKRQRLTTVVVRVPRPMMDRTLWPQYMRLRDSLTRHLNQATEQLIREEVYGA
jgi:hypothetical protein